MTRSYAIETRGLRKTYGATTALDAFDVQVPAGTVVGFVGPNGAGKTTVIRLLSTVLSPDSGTFTIAGIPDTSPAEIRRRIGVLPEGAGYPASQTGEEWLVFHAQLFGQTRPSARSAAQRLLAEVGLAERGRSAVSTYSRGMRQRLGVARALVNDPQVVLLDEPTLGLDPSGQRQLLELVVRIARDHGVTVLMSTHMLADVEDTCDEVLILNDGRTLAYGTVADVVRRAGASRRALLRVSVDQQARAVEVLAGAPQSVAPLPGSHRGEVELTLPAGSDPEAASAQLLRLLSDSRVPVFGYSIEGGRLSDAFLAITEDDR